MSGIEGIKAFRALEREPWLREFQEAAPEIVGEDALDFDDRALGTQEVEILGAGKFMALRNMLPPTVSVDGEQLADIAEERRPDSFHVSLSLITTGKLGIKYMRDQNEDRRQALVARIHQTRIIVDEQRALEGVVDEAVGAVSTGRLPFLKAKLAIVNEGCSIPDKNLARLANLLPERMRVQAGQITHIDIGPGSVKDPRADLEEFAQASSIEATQGVAEAAVYEQLR